MIGNAKIWLSSLLSAGLLASCMPAATAPVITPVTSVYYVGKLTGSEQVPPLTVAGTGSVTLTLKDNKVTLTGTYSGLTGEAKAAHIHAPALKGSSAGVYCTLMLMPSTPVGTGVLMEGDCGNKILSVSDMSDLAAGKWYVNVHTAANGGGEIRAQLFAK